MNSLIYVDKKLIVPIGAKVIGSSLSIGDKTATSGGFSWFVAASLEMSKEKGVVTNIAELFPEDLFYSVYGKLSNTLLSVRNMCEAISNGKLKSADVVSAVGTLRIPDIQVETYNPFDPPAIELAKTYTIYGEECFSAELISDGYKFPVYFRIESKEIVGYANNKPVEVVGALKWSPGYEVAGFVMNQILLAAALLLRR